MGSEEVHRGGLVWSG